MNIEEQSLKLKETLKKAIIERNITKDLFTKYSEQEVLNICQLSTSQFELLVNETNYLIIDKNVDIFEDSVVYIGNIDNNNIDKTIIDDFNTTGLFISSNIWFLKMDISKLEHLFKNPLNLIKFVKQFKIGAEASYKNGSITKEEYEQVTKSFGSIFG